MKAKIKYSGLILTILLLFFLASGAVSAHQPRIDSGSSVTIDNPIMVEDPEISQAFYGQLQGKPVFYQIKSDKPFQLYINLLVPTSPGQGGELISAEVTNEAGEVVMFLNGTNSTWTPYFEEFGGDYYLKGPEETLQVPAGTYTIKVFNSENQGKYSIAIGKIESFPPDEAITSLFTIPQLKQQFFGKPISTLFVEFVGIILALGSIMALLVLMVKSRKSEDLTQVTLKVGAALKPLIWVGTIVATIVWAWVIYQNPLNIMGLLNSLLLLIILILTWYVLSSVMKAETKGMPLKSMILLAILWWLYTILAIVVI